jgi:hypothetical protein
LDQQFQVGPLEATDLAVVYDEALLLVEPEDHRLALMVSLVSRNWRIEAGAGAFAEDRAERYRPHPPNAGSSPKTKLGSKKS